MEKESKKIVCIGGGTGVPLVMRGLKDKADLTAIITMFDSGGHSGKLREELNVLPIGDIRECLINSASEEASEIVDTFSVRFPSGVYKGDSLGNLYIAATIQKKENIEEAIEELRRILGVKAKIFPVTLEKADLKLTLNTNEEFLGEENIVNCANLSKEGIKKLRLEPEVSVNPAAIKAIEKADLIVIGPGKFYTSIIPNLLVKGVSEAINKSKGKKVFICNLMTQPGNTDNFKVERFVEEIEKYLGGKIDFVIFNTREMPENLIAELRKTGSKSEFVEYRKDLSDGDKFMGADILDLNFHQAHPSDILLKGNNQRTRILHDTNKLAKIIIDLLEKCKL